MDGKHLTNFFETYVVLNFTNITTNCLNQFNDRRKRMMHSVIKMQINGEISIRNS